VQKLLEDGTLGLLLHGTSVVGFCSPQAEEYGWLIGDQIVEINGHRVSVFDEFLDRFLAAQEEGFPIDFSVLRRETLSLAGGAAAAAASGNAISSSGGLANLLTAGAAAGSLGAEGALDNFFDATDLGDLAGQMQRKFGGPLPHGSEALSPAMSGLPPDEKDEHLSRSDSITENPYIQALRKRRSELLKSAEGWENTDSLASRLATQRSDALATLLNAQGASRRAAGPADCGAAGVGATDCGAIPDEGSGPGLRLPAQFSGLPAWPLSLSCGNGRGCGNNEAAAYEIQPTPRADVESDLDARQFEPVSARNAWNNFGSPAKESRMPNHLSLKLGGQR